QDVTVVRIDFTSAPGTNCLSLDTRFMSEEYPEFPGKIYNDGFIAELDINDWTTLNSSILGPHNFAFRVDAPASNGEPLNVRTTGDASASASNAQGTFFDGGTPLLRSQTTMSPGSHSLYVSILDQGDGNFDSVVMLDRLTAWPAPRRKCGLGASPLVRPTLTRPALVTRSSTTRTYGLSVQSESRLKRVVVKIDGRAVRVRPFFSSDNREVRILVPVANDGLSRGRHTMTFDVANRAGTSSARLEFTN
ncbi:MAG TPA: choice-of-anchor L domain-containing protein, partial [Gemmatimonadaceae bacterium]|nr:choice-of-anchor L domain-containing protein [Gemmatimonadaceae bacterium]